MMLQPIDFKSDHAADYFVASMKKYGFAIFKNHPIDMEDIDQLYHRWLMFFHAEETQKMQFYYNREDLSGYVPATVSEVARGYQHRDLKELYHYYPGKIIPLQQQAISDKILLQTNQLATFLLTWLEEGGPSPAEKWPAKLPEMIEGSQRTLFRLNYYPALKAHHTQIADGAKRAEAHNDINLITILPSASTAGLQILTPDNQWLDVPHAQEYLVVNAGDMLSLYTNQYYPSVLHRVIVPEDLTAERISLAVCIHPRDEVVLSEQHTAKSYLEERVKELGLTDSALGPV